MKTYRNGAMLTVLVAMMVAGTAFGSANAATGIDIMLENDGNKVIQSTAWKNKTTKTPHDGTRWFHYKHCSSRG